LLRARAVEQPEVVPVPMGQDPVANREADVVDLHYIGPECPRIAKRLAGAGVQVVDVIAAKPEHHDVPARRRRSQPLRDHGVTDEVGVVADRHVAVFDEPSERSVHAAAAQVDERGPLLWIGPAGGFPSAHAVPAAVRGH